jgi:hypothetical protein
MWVFLNGQLLIKLMVENFIGIERNTIMFVGVSGYSLTQNYLVIAVSKRVEYNCPVYKTKLVAFVLFIQETHWIAPP